MIFFPVRCNVGPVGNNKTLRRPPPRAPPQNVGPNGRPARPAGRSERVRSDRLPQPRQGGRAARLGPPGARDRQPKRPPQPLARADGSGVAALLRPAIASLQAGAPSGGQMFGGVRQAGLGRGHGAGRGSGAAHARCGRLRN